MNDDDPFAPSNLPGPAAIDALIALLPRMEAPSGDVEEELIGLLGEGGFLIPYDWPSCQEEGRLYVEEPDKIESADLATLCRLFTLHVRKDRFCEGHFAAMLANGHLAALIRRLAAIRSRPIELSEAAFRAGMEETIRRDIKSIAKQSALVGVDGEHWDVTRISWTGAEWPGLSEIRGLCYVEAFEHANPPHDFIFAVSVAGGVPDLLATYEGDLDFFELTIARVEADSLGLPDRIPR